MHKFTAEMCETKSDMSLFHSQLLGEIMSFFSLLLSEVLVNFHCPCNHKPHMGTHCFLENSYQEMSTDCYTENEVAGT